MKKKKLIETIAKYAIKHNHGVSLEVKKRKSNSNTFISDSGTEDAGLELRIMPKGEDE